MAQSHLITTQNYLPSLEGWRGVVALFVVSYHFSKLFFDQDWTPFGYLGVDFFFILSGFIIARQYEAAIAVRTVNFRTFAIRRIARLWPLYIISIIFFLLVNYYVIEPLYNVKILDFGMGPVLMYRIFLQITMLGNLTVMAQPNGPVWSVSVEWIVNLIFFALVWHYRRVPNIMLWLVAALGGWYLISESPHNIQVANLSVPIVRGIVGFSLGWLIFRYHQMLPVLPVVVLYTLEIALLWVAITLALFHQELLKYSVDYMFELFIFPALITMSLYRRGLINFIFSRMVMRFLGRISYSVYLMHYPLAYLMEYTPSIHAIGRPWLGISYIIILIGLSTLTYLFIENPGRWIGRRMTRRMKPLEVADK